MEHLSRSVDIYCERLGPGFWAEPVNAVTNLAFLVAAVVAWREASRRQRLDPGNVLLIALVGAIGVGSFLFHTLATVAASLADVLPIQLFIVAYLVLALRRLVGLGWTASVALGIGFVPAAAWAARALRATLGDALNGSEGYLPALAALVAVTLALAARRSAASRLLGVAAILLAVSLGFRSVDERVCASWPLGTHFVWHLVNGLVLWILLHAMIRHGGRAPQS